MMKVLCTRAAKCEAGATAIEYSLTAALVSMALYAGADRLGHTLAEQFQSLSRTIPADGPRSQFLRTTAEARPGSVIAAAAQEP
ncbi:Flp family type IVb pilin [Hoeflea sp. YIM 152468]|uniref:Flp family type IVb pilin n=1 Tax=Hoeflea sp. YIM 152468 TaxID=3031759 RepID=UPI0031B84F60